MARRVARRASACGRQGRWWRWLPTRPIRPTAAIDPATSSSRPRRLDEHHELVPEAIDLGEGVLEAQLEIAGLGLRLCGPGLGFDEATKQRRLARRGSRRA